MSDTTSPFFQQIMDLLGEAVERYGSARALSRASGVAAPNITRWRAGVQTPRVKDIAPIMDLLGVKAAPAEAPKPKDVCWVESKVVPAGDGQSRPESEDYLAVPLVEEVGAGPGIIPQGRLQGWFLVWRWQPAIMHRGDLIAVMIGDGSTSMVPTLYPKDVVLVDRQDIDCSHPGHIMLAIDPDGAGMIKRVAVEHKPESHDVGITFYSDNAPENPPKTYSLRADYGGDWRRAIGGRVVWAWSNMTRR